jgi:hypothetical protein
MISNALEKKVKSRGGKEMKNETKKMNETFYQSLSYLYHLLILTYFVKGFI